ncbi:MAG TPA: NUDIX domain-containing protein [Candidatus Coprovivens excrementavium]|nr:NUDIX domain-containing protein [Candidatus Coprovivens excrementavium]
MNEINHKFLLIQDGASAIIINDKKQILLQRRVDNDKWGLPGGCQEIGETFEETVIREVKEETNLDVKKEDLKLITIVSGNTRRRQYLNGDIVYNNSALYLIDKYEGDLKCDEESKVLEFFDIDNLPLNQHDEDLVQAYLKALTN